MSIGVFPYEYSVLDGRGLDPFVVHALDLEAAHLVLQEVGQRPEVGVLTATDRTGGHIA